MNLMQPDSGLDEASELRENFLDIGSSLDPVGLKNTKDCALAHGCLLSIDWLIVAVERLITQCKIANKIIS